MFRPSVFAVARLKQRVPTGSTARLGDRQASRHGGSYPRTRPSNAAGRPLMMVRARIVVFRNPICFIKYCKVSGPGQARLFRRVVAASSPACRSTAAAIATVYGVSPSQNAEEHPAPRDEHTLERLTSCSPARWSGKNGTPCWHSATSNDASGKGMASALPSTQVTGVPGRAWKRSRHSQHPRVEIQAGDLTCRADLLRREPLHHSSAAATSSTRSPGRRSASSTRSVFPELLARARSTLYSASGSTPSAAASSRLLFGLSSRRSATPSVAAT